MTMLDSIIVLPKKKKKEITRLDRVLPMEMVRAWTPGYAGF